MYKENDKRQEGLFYPSLEVERKTKAMNKYISGLVSLLALFPVCIFVLVMYHAFMSYFLELVSSFIMDYFVFVVLIPVLICLVLSYKIVLMMHAFLVSYKFQGNQIIKGVIIAPVKKQKIDRVISDTITVANAINAMGSNGNYQNRRTVRRAFRFFRMMRDNMNPEIVQAYFDTDFYNKKVYNNPQLIKTTKYTLVYRCENKKLVIPKIYEGMFPVENKKGLSLISRVIARTVIVTGVAFLIATVDLAIGYGRNNEYESNVSGARTEILNVLEEYGYESESTNPKFASFTKELDGGERRSRIGYTFDRSGNVTNVNVQLYYAPSTASATDELLFIISTINDDFDEEVEEFIGLVEESVAGNYQNGILKGDNYKLTLGRSEDYLDIHSY